MRIPTVDQLEDALVERGWVLHHEPGRIQIVILRRTPGTLDAFDDMLIVLDSDRGDLWACRCTADPGKPARERPKRREGTAVLAECQLVDGFALGTHHPGKPDAYPCLVPVGPVPVLRYTSVDDPTGTPSTSDLLQIHRANAARESTVVGAWSEACVVVANPVDYDELLDLVRAAAAAGWRRVTVSCLAWPA